MLAGFVAGEAISVSVGFPGNRNREFRPRMATRADVLRIALSQLEGEEVSDAIRLSVRD
jgi:hypothetical protein